MAATALAHAKPFITTTTPPPLPPDPISLVLNAASGTVLTVGAGMEFATLHDALTAAVAGDTIAVQAGTYTNDFATVTVPVTILAIGGIVNEVATIEPPNGKGLITADASLDIRGFTFTGGNDGSFDGNVAGIRYESGNLRVAYCDFHDNEDGLLATPLVTGTGTIVIDHSEFAHNGTGDGYSHNLYVGPVASLLVTNSYFHDAVVGHEIKSRAALTVIVNNVIADGPSGTASYDIDLPNAGIGRIVGNFIEKGANASNTPIIHYGGETQFAWSRNALTVASNTIVNDMSAALAVGILNQSTVNGLAVPANLIGNRLWNLQPGRLIFGAGTATANTVLTREPAYSTASPWTNLPPVRIEAGPQLLNLETSGHAITGGTAMLTVSDAAGTNTIAGGSGGLDVTALTGNEVVSTASGAADTINAGGRYDNITSAGADWISLSGQYDGVTATGQATINSSQYDTFVLDGAETLNASGGGGAQLGSGARVTAAVTLNDLSLTLAGGAWLALDDGRGGMPSTATISGGGETVWAGGGGISVTTGGGGGVVDGGRGALYVAGGNGRDSVVASTGLSKIVLGGGTDTVAFAGGIAEVAGGTGADTYVFTQGQGGSAQIAGFKQGADMLSFQGFTGNPVAGGVVAGGNTVLSLTDGTTLTLLGVALAGYGGGTGGGNGGGMQSGNVTLTTSGQSVTGGASLLTVTDLAGGNTIAGGTGGLTATVAALQDLVTTNLSATDLIVLTRQDTVLGAGADTVQVAGNYNTVTETGPAAVTLAAGGNLVQGGGSLLTVADSQGANSIVGGAGGLVVTGSASYEAVRTAAGAADTVAVGGYASVQSAGNDQITLGGYYPGVTASGTSSIVSNAGDGSYILNGAETLAASGIALVTVGGGASTAVAIGATGQSFVAKADGASLSLAQALPNGGTAAVALAGGAASLTSSGGRYAGISVTTGAGAGVAIHAQGGPVAIVSAGADTIWAGAGPTTIQATGSNGVDVVAGTGNTTLYGGAGPDMFTAGSGTAQIWLGAGADTVTLGSGQLTINGGLGADSVIAAYGSGGGNDVITGWAAGDQLVFQGFAGAPIATQSVNGGSTLLQLTDGSQITLVGVTHF